MSRTLKTLALCTVGILALACDPKDTDTTDTPDVDDTTDGLPDGIDCTDTLCTIEGGTYTGTVHLDAEHEYVLNGIVFIGEDDQSSTGTLRIDAGTTIYGTSESAVIISRGSVIEAEGTATAPIVFTSAQNDGARAPGDWGGLVLNGNATNNAGVDIIGEAGTGTHGGTDDADSSGILTYVRVEFGGFEIDSQNQVNGIAFQSVGSGTVVDYIQVHQNKDDGVEFFGGTVDVKHVVITGAGDDAFDWTQGWRGRAQWAVLQGGGRSERLIEGDNLEGGEDNLPRSEPWLANFTLVGSGDDAGDVSLEGAVLRRGTGAHLTHVIVTEAGKGCLDIDSVSTYENAWNNGAPTGAITVDNSVFHCAQYNDGDTFREGDDDADTDEDGTPDWFAPFSVDELVMDHGLDNLAADPELSMPKSTTTPDFMPSSMSPAMADYDLPAGWGSWFTETDYIGAVGDSDWTAGWTSYPTH